MESRFNKPRVFLSHSKADVSFIEQVHIDLRKCQIEPWLDSAEIRHGKPWLDAIFEHGIPTCDAVLVYFTEASLESKMVKKEMDAGILQQLQDKGVAFLPYVDEKSRRSKLRADIQALQVPVWNLSNYNDMLPPVVAEVWRSYLERMIVSSVQEERVMRLQAELELERLKKDSSGSIFSSSEEAEFRYIWDTLSKSVQIEVEELKRITNHNGIVLNTVSVRKYNLDINLSSAISVIMDGGKVEFNFARFLAEQAMMHLSKSGGPGDPSNIFIVKKYPNVDDDLMMYGFIERISVSGRRDRNLFSKKCYRFRYWLAFNKMLPTSVEFGENIEITNLAMPN